MIPMAAIKLPLEDQFHLSMVIEALFSLWANLRHETKIRNSSLSKSI